ncbi:hypothetical protein K1X84_09620 [bacterium]|nr:hypothetical protein [bacterium]
MLSETEIREAFEEIIKGKIVKRFRHSLVHDGNDCTELFIKLLNENNFVKKTVSQTHVDVGFRCPAFLIVHQEATFGWVKWMNYNHPHYLKFFASEERKPSGSPTTILKPEDPTYLYVNERLAEEHDCDAPPLFE